MISSCENWARICVANGPVTVVSVPAGGFGVPERAGRGADATGAAPVSGAVSAGDVVPVGVGLAAALLVGGAGGPTAGAGSANAGRGVSTQTTVQTSTGHSKGRAPAA